MTTYGIENIRLLFLFEDESDPSEPHDHDPPPDPDPDPDPPTPEFLFTSQTPASSASDGPYTLGTLISSDVDGQVLGIRLFVGAQTPRADDAMVGQLYQWISNSSGTLLATTPTIPQADFTLNAWNELMFDTPVDITAGTVYVAAVGAIVRYVSSGHFFDGVGPGAADLINGHLTAPHSTTGQLNGKFKVSSLAYPTDAFNASCYFVDFLFLPDEE